MKTILLKLSTLAVLCFPVMAMAEDVNVETFVRAESDRMIRANMEAFGLKFGTLFHSRQMTTPDNQPTIRSNQDTLYTVTVLDLNEPIVITLPEIDGRYMSMHVVNQDHFMFVESTPGAYTLTEEDVGTRFAFVIIRTYAEIADPADVEAAHAAQDSIEMTGGGSGPFEAPDWNLDDLNSARQSLSDVAILGFDSSYAFGRENETRPIDHLVGAAAGWGGLPRAAATYLIDSVEANDGATPHTITVGDVPVDAFWSVTVYNAEGFLEPNDLNVNNYNNFSADPNDDGTVTLNFGGCEDGRLNCIPITPGWNYAIRLYQPRAEILDGSWEFPAIEPAG